MTVIHHSRRQFLRGTGGFLLALPILPSLFPRTAQAQASQVTPRFIAFATDHGCLYNQRMWPADSMLSEQVAHYSDHIIRRGKLTLRSDGARVGLSDVLSASSGTLTSSLAEKLNVIRGLDIPFYISHHSGGHLGNYAHSEGTAESVKANPRPTIDQVMAYSSSFYSNLATVKERSLNVGIDGRWAMSWGYENPQTRTGVAPLPTAYSALDLFNRVFVPPTEGGEPSRKPVVDHVLESYNRLRKGAFGDANRLSTHDARRLDDHMQRLSELQRTLNVVASCGESAPPSLDATNASRGQADTNPQAQSEWYQTFNDVIVAGLICGTTRIATIHAADNFDTSPIEQWHNGVAHLFNEPDKQELLVKANRSFFETVFLDLAAKLDIEEADGKTYLDNSLVMWSQESGMEVHESIGSPVITAGGAAGYFHTGNYVDYSNRENLSVSYPDTPGTQARRPGILYSQWLANVCMSMGLKPEEFEQPGEKGYGNPFRDEAYCGPAARAWPDRLFSDASKPLPFLAT
jgi:hypothetical protein